MPSLAPRSTRLLAALALISGLGCGDVEQPAADSPATLSAALVDEALLAELLGEAAEAEDNRVSADGLLVRLAFEPLIRGTGPASLQLVQSQGYRLTGVAERGPLWQLGLREGDVLTLVDGEPIIAREHELRSSWEARPSNVELTFMRGEETRILKLRIRSGASWKRVHPSLDVLEQRDAADRRLLDRAQFDPASPSSQIPEPRSELSQSLRCTPSSDDDDPLVSRCELLRSALEQLMSDPNAFARGARVVPSIRDGESVGFKLYAIRPSSALALLGLHNGDLITSVNGHALTGLDDAMEVYTTLREASELELELERRGRARRLQVVFVDALPKSDAHGDPSRLDK